jgi:hypothetical protein
MQKTNEILLYCLWPFLLTVIILVVVWNEYHEYHLGTWLAIGAGGFAFWFLGFPLAGKGAPTSTINKNPVAIPGKPWLQNFYLNGYYFQPYEQETPGGRRQFRLFSSPPISADHEAAVIRYLINEGLSDKMWPRMSRRIEEEANWAFFA